MSQMLLSIPNETKFDLCFTLLKVPVRVHPLHWIMGALIVNGAAGADLRFLLVGVACVFVSILVHEFGHALSGRHFGDNGNRVILYMMGGLCVPGWRGTPPRLPRIKMIFWGPLAGLLLAAIAYGVQYSMQQN